MQLHVVVHIFMSCKEKWNWIRHEDGHPLMQGLNRMKRMRVKAVSRFLQLLGCSTLHFDRRQLPAGVGVRAISRGFSAMRNDGDFAEASPSRSFQVVVAATRELGIGKNGRLPWKLPSDMKFFKEITSTTTTACKRNAVIMGRKTWESIPPMFRPLPGRLNVVLTRSDIPIADNQKDNVLVCGGLHSALGLLAAPPYALSIETVFVIGGAQIYGYTDMHAAYSGRGFDQLADMIHKIKSNPEGQCLMLSSWNPADLKLMALPPCCMFAQFYIANGELSCQMYQRSCDMCLEVPFSIASYALLTCWIAHVCDLVPGDFVHVLGDVHVYKKHVVPLLVQLKNVPRPFPVLKINPEKMDVDSFVASDFRIIGYEYHKKPEMEMAVEIPDRRTLSPQ